MSNRSFDEVLEEIKSSGEKERETIEIAEELSRIISDFSEARIKKGLTQRQLADVSGIKQAAIARMESLQAIPRLDTLIKVARSLDIKINVESTISSTSGVLIGLVVPAYSWKTSEAYGREKAESREGRLRYATAG